MKLSIVADWVDRGDWVDKADNNHYGQYDPCVTQDQVGLHTH